MPPLPGSPVLDGCTNGTSFTTDQRGYPRIVGPYADIVRSKDPRWGLIREETGLAARCFRHIGGFCNMLCLNKIDNDFLKRTRLRPLISI
jgi:hypothetical protein